MNFDRNDEDTEAADGESDVDEWNIEALEK